MEKSSAISLAQTARFPGHYINSVPFSIEKRPLRSYWEDASTYGIEEISAALARVETVLRCLGYPSPGRSLSENSAGNTEAFAYSPEFLVNLLALMRREPALRAYLDPHRDEAENSTDPLAAWAAASGDVAFFLNLRERGWEPSVSRYIELAKSVIVPAMLIVLTAFFGNRIATDLQREAFKHQRTFDVRLVGLQKGQDRAAELYTSLNEIYSTIADLEGQKFTGLQTNKLRAERQKLDSIQAASKLYDSDDIVGKAIVDAEVLLDNYIECLDSKREKETVSPTKEPSVNCSEQNKNILTVFDEILNAHTLAMTKLVNSES
ncbi:MAG TPA: hypothetical protein VKM72_17035 [Thermoanaerobaculia bacterium]|nr:hypothetical protein [Thermoanaerobaculia bacterium]